MPLYWFQHFSERSTDIADHSQWLYFKNPDKLRILKILQISSDAQTGAQR